MTVKSNFLMVVFLDLYANVIALIWGNMVDVSFEQSRFFRILRFFGAEKNEAYD